MRNISDSGTNGSAFVETDDRDTKEDDLDVVDDDNPDPSMGRAEGDRYARPGRFSLSGQPIEVHILASRCPPSPILRGCWLYNHVALSTMAEPNTKVNVMRKSNSATDARKEMTMLKLVAKPLRMLSEYFMTIAVTKPPKTWTLTVAQAQGPKSWKNADIHPATLPSVFACCVMRMGAMHGMRLNRDSWTLRTQRSPGEFFRTISKYTPASPDVKHAATTAKKPFVAFSVCADDSESPFLAHPVWIWTTPTPMAKKRSAIHWVESSFLRSNRTEKAAVVRIFIW